jgi:pimeloyl-ACP methyl ester carboxylesterase
MDTGLCQGINSWGRVPSALAQFTRVITYERAGLGFSDKGPSPRTSQRNVAELQTLLLKAEITGPLVLVGHSFGGFNVRLFASQHPSTVVGMVLIDSSYENQFHRFAALKSPGEKEVYLQHESGANCEQVDMLASAEEVSMTAPPPPIPITILTADGIDRNGTINAAVDGELRQAQQEMQADLARVMPNSRHFLVKNSGHFIQLDQPDLVIHSIQTVVELARTKLYP